MLNDFYCDVKLGLCGDIAPHGEETKSNEKKLQNTKFPN